MKRREGNARSQFSAAEFPALREFLSAYLHEDFHAAYGSAAVAAEAFCAEAAAAQLGQARREWARLRNRFAGKPLPEFQDALQKLGAAWRPQTETDLRQMDEALAPRENS